MQQLHDWIVVAWLVYEQEYDGEPYARDLGARPTMREVKVPRAVVWKTNGTDDDVRKASKHARAEYGEGFAVYTHQDETDPHGRARRDILRA